MAAGIVHAGTMPATGPTDTMNDVEPFRDKEPTMSIHLVIAASAVSAGTVTLDRAVASAAAALAVVAVIIGTIALRRSAAPDGIRRADRRSIAALVAGIVSAATGGVIL